MNLPAALATWLNEYAPILFGLLAGAVAHFGRKMMLGERPTRMHLIGFVMQLGLIGLIASVGTRVLDITDDDTRALATALLALSLQEVIEQVKRSGWRPFASAAVPSTYEGERRQAEQLSRSARYFEDDGRLDDVVEKIVGRDKK